MSLKSTQDAALNKARNRQHYNSLLRSTSIDRIVEKVERADAFLDDATRTGTSWVALYSGGFRERLRGAKVLELGSGDGLNSCIMAAMGADVVSVDISEVAVDMLNTSARRLGLGSRIHAMAGDFASIPMPLRQFDFVVGKAFLHHLTHEVEEAYLRKVAAVLRPGGEARFSEPAINSLLLDSLRWVIPVPGRPSSLNVKAFVRYKEDDPHPVRDNSSAHYRESASRLFASVTIVPLGSLERFERFLPPGKLSESFSRFAFRTERLLPAWFRMKTARAQLLVFREPRQNTAVIGTLAESP